MQKTEQQNLVLSAGVELEYKSLRDEILTRIRLRQQLIWYTLTVSGVFLGFGLTNPQVSLIYPVFALFLAFGWAQNDYRIRNVATYIREHLEVCFQTPGWETQIRYKSKKSGLNSWRFVVLSHGGTFLVTQLMAIVVGFFPSDKGGLEWSLFIIDLAAMFGVLWILKKSLK